MHFRAAQYTSEGHATIRYTSDVGGKPDVVVYSARPIQLARAYYCLPRLHQSVLSAKEAILVDPLLVPADSIERLLEQTA